MNIIIYAIIIGCIIGYVLTIHYQTISPLSSTSILIVVTVPESHADIVREAMGKAGAGKFGNYTFCSFSHKGIGRFLPGSGANPTFGHINKLETVPEETIQSPCEIKFLNQVITAIKKVHPYEESGIFLMPLYKQ